MSQSPIPAEEGGPQTESQPLSKEPQGQSAAASGASLTEDDQELREKYRYADCAVGSMDSKEGGYPVCHPIDFVQLLKKQPEIAEYVEEISFWPHCEGVEGDEEEDDSEEEEDDSEEEEDDSEEGENNPSSKVQKEWPVLSAQLDKFGLSAEQTEKWTQSLKDGDAPSCFTILMSMLPNVRILRLPDDCDETFCWLNVLLRMAQSPGSSQLSKLSHVIIHHDDSEGGEHLSGLEELIFLPSMRKISGHMLGDNGSDWTPSQDITTKASPVEHVQLDYSQSSVSSTLQLIALMRNLRALDYGGQGEWIMSGYFTEDDFRADFQAKLVPLLNQRGLVWKIGTFSKNAIGACDDIMCSDEGYRIRCAELAHELDDIKDVCTASHIKVACKPAGTDGDGNDIEVVTYSIG